MVCGVSDGGVRGGCRVCGTIGRRGQPAPVQTSGIQRCPRRPRLPHFPTNLRRCPTRVAVDRGRIRNWCGNGRLEKGTREGRSRSRRERSEARRSDLVQMIVVPARTLFAVQERLIFEVQIPQALQLYVASEGKPKTNREFMENIIVRNGIELPELPSGQRYVYDPQKEELMVEKPADQ